VTNSVNRALLLGLVAVAAIPGVAQEVSPEMLGRSKFIQHCSGCHGLIGRGPGLVSGIPDFQDYVGAFATDDLGRTYVLHVPGVANANLTDNEAAAVMNYVMVTWGGTSLSSGFIRFTAQEVFARRLQLVSDVVLLRRQIVQRLRAKGVLTAPYPWP
jgi:hypothetical protein